MAFRFLEHAHLVLGCVLTSLSTMLGQLLTMGTQLRYSFSSLLASSSRDAQFHNIASIKMLMHGVALMLLLGHHATDKNNPLKHSPYIHNASTFGIHVDNKNALLHFVTKSSLPSLSLSLS